MLRLCADSLGVAPGLVGEVGARIRRAREDDVVHRRLAGVDVLLVGLRVFEADDIAVLHQQELVDGRELRSVLSGAGGGGSAVSRRGIPGAVGIPAGARIEAEVLLHLVVVESERRVRHRDGGEDFLAHSRHQVVRGCVLRYGDVVAGEHGDLAAATCHHLRRLVRVNHYSFSGIDCPEFLRSIVVHGVDGIRVSVGVLAERHEVAVAVVCAVGADGRAHRVDVVYDFVEVAEAVAVGIPVHRARADEELFEVVEAVVVRVGARPGVGNVRVVEVADFLGGDYVVVAFDVGEVEAAAGHFVGAGADHRAVPHIVFVAVGHSVAVGILNGRVCAVFDGEAPGLGEFEVAPSVVDPEFGPLLLLPPLAVKVVVEESAVIDRIEGKRLGRVRGMEDAGERVGDGLAVEVGDCGILLGVRQPVSADPGIDEVGGDGRDFVFDVGGYDFQIVRVGGDVVVGHVEAGLAGGAGGAGEVDVREEVRDEVEFVRLARVAVGD